MADYDECVQLMKSDGEDERGLGKYPEYVDTFVGRGLAREGLADWEGAVREYDKAISLWGGPTTSQRDAAQDYNAARYEGVNPYVLTFRGNALTRLVGDYAARNAFIAHRFTILYACLRIGTNKHCETTKPPATFSLASAIFLASVMHEPTTL